MGEHIHSVRGSRASCEHFPGIFFPDRKKALAYLTEGLCWTFGTNHHKLTWKGICFEHASWCNAGGTLRKTSIYRALIWKSISLRFYAHHIPIVDIMKYAFHACSEVHLQFTCSPWTVMAYAWLNIAADGLLCKDALCWGLSRLVTHWSRTHTRKAHFPSYSEVKYFWIPAWFVLGILRMFLFFW